LQCPGCSAEAPEGSKFCGKCGTALPRACPNCGQTVPPENSFCSECGASVVTGSTAPTPSLTLQAPPTTAPIGSPAERRQLTIMFCDMVGSSALSTRLDPEEQGEIIAEFHVCCTKEIKALGGMVAQYLGDGVLAYFGYPAAHENDAERAILAGLAILKAVASLKPNADVVVQTRIAVGSGIVVVGDLVRHGVSQENAAIGETTNLVARLQAIAEPDTLVISPLTYRLVGALFDYRDLGRHALKGFPEPVHVRQVLGASKVESRFEAQHQSGTSPLVGRREELDLLLRRWAEAKRGEGRVVLLTGEPGIGKSRMASALRENLRSDPHTPLSYFCSPHRQGSALYPFIGQLIRAAGIDRDDSAKVKLDKLQTLVAQSSGKFSEDMPLLAALLSIPGGDRYPLPELVPQRRKERTFAALFDQMISLATRHPLLVVFEDLQWIDPTSLELLSLASEQIGDQRIFLLATARPEFTQTWPNHQHTSTLTLNRLGRSDGQALIMDVTRGKALPVEVRNQIIGRTDGVPLFIEELTKTVLESGLLRETDDHFELTGPLPILAIPSTLHASLLARLDRLAAVKDVAQIGAVIGREFSYPLVAAVAAFSEKDLNAALTQLVEAELIYQRGAPPDATYQFKHALVQDASYSSLVRSRRRQLHGAIARALEQRFPDIVETEPETLAHHSTEAGLTEPALSYWLRAGQRATTRSAYQEALRHLERGLALLETLPVSTNRDRRELDYLMALRVPLTAVTGFALNQDYEARSERANVLAEKLGDVERLDASLNAQYDYCRATGKFGKARNLAERGRTLALRHGDRVMQLRAHHVMADSLLQRGEFAEAQNEFKQVLSLYDPERDRSIPYLPANQFVVSSTYFAWALWITGYPERAAEMQAQAFSHAADLDQLITTGYVRFHAGAQLEQLFGNVSAMLAHTKVLDALFSEHGINTWQGMSSFFKGWVLATCGEAENGIPYMQQALTLLDTKNVGIHVPYFMSLLAQSYAAVGNTGAALDLSRGALERVQQTGQHIWLAEMHRIDGEIRHAARNPLSDVEDCYSKALEVSRRQGAKAFELRAATTLARLWRGRGANIEARNLLVPVYAWYTEGFGTADLKAADALLAELRA
jgi:class 3 adenylate cyclase/predicted ATPase